MVYPRAAYLAVSSRSSRSRGHFAVFIPNELASSRDLTVGKGQQDPPACGTVIHVVGEPLMSGYRLEFKRNYDILAHPGLQKLLPLGHVDADDVASIDDAAPSVLEGTPRGRIEHVAAAIPPPPKGQDVRAPIDGINARRCQEWTKEYVQKLADGGLISPGAPEVVEKERDSPTHAIFGQQQR